MGDRTTLVWPPPEIRTERLVLREPEARDREAVVDLFTAPEVGTYIGGHRSRNEFEDALPEVPPRRPGLLVVDLDGSMVGIVTLDHGDDDGPGPRRPDGGSVDLGYLFLPEFWGHGYASEACAAVLGWFADAHPGVPVTLRTQSANERSMRLAATLGFTEVGRFEQYGAEQWSGVWRSESAPTRRR
ncbi:GNAT family N-acetyltransferase [Cellulosimicrobium terreum]|nr:GNAT family N-acetyltransferase [Cellulosimicrobium terreum]